MGQNLLYIYYTDSQKVLLNVHDTTSVSGRAFLLQPEIMDGIEDSVLAVFYDL